MDEGNQIVIRAAKVGDEAEIANVHINSWREAYRDLLPRSYLDQLPLNFKRRMSWWTQVIRESDKYVLHVAEARSGIVGFACFSEGRDDGMKTMAELQAIYLFERHKGQGIGFKLLASGFKQMIEREFREAYCWVLESNPTIKFYERSGAKFNGMTKIEEIDGQKVRELAYSWSDLKIGNYQIEEQQGFGETMSLELKINQDTRMTLVNRQHAEEFLRLINSNRKYLREWLGWLDTTRTVEDLHKFVDACVSEFSAKKGLSAWIWHQNKMVGIMHLKEVDYVNRKAMIGYWVGEQYRGKGLAKSACRAMIDFAIGEWKMNRIEIRCATENKASQAIPRSLGFREEGVLRQNEWLYDRFVDHKVFGLVAADWPRITDPVGAD